MEAVRGAPAGKEERSGERELGRKIAELERAPGSKTYELEIAGRALRTWEVSVRVAQARVLVAEGDALATGARVMQITRQAIYRVPRPRTAPASRPGGGPSTR